MKKPHTRNTGNSNSEKQVVQSTLRSFPLLTSTANNDLFLLMCSFLTNSRASSTSRVKSTCLSLVLVMLISRSLYERGKQLEFWEFLASQMLLPPPKPRAIKYKTSYDLICKYYVNLGKQRQEACRKAARRARQRCGRCGEIGASSYPIKDIVPHNQLCRECWLLPEFYLVHKSEALEYGFTRSVIASCKFYKYSGKHWIYMNELKKRDYNKRNKKITT